LTRRDSAFKVMSRYAGEHPILVVLGDTACAAFVGLLLGMIVEGGFVPGALAYVFALVGAVVGAVIGVRAVRQARRTSFVFEGHRGVPPYGQHS